MLKYEISPFYILQIQIGREQGCAYGELIRYELSWGLIGEQIEERWPHSLPDQQCNKKEDRTVSFSDKVV